MGHESPHYLFHEKKNLLINFLLDIRDKKHPFYLDGFFVSFSEFILSWR